MPSRRFHTKSRLGCANCKQRKIRCGEERPVCENCGRLPGSCSYLQSDPQGGTTLQHIGSEFKPGEPPREAILADKDALAFEPLNKYDEELMQHWTQSTSHKMSDRADLVTTWQLTVPSLAVHHAFLRHGLLALAAMHIRYRCPPPT